MQYELFQARRNLGGFDEKAWAESSNLSYKGEVQDVVSCRPTPGINGRMLRWKERQFERIERTYREDVALYIEALLFGEGRLLDEETSFSYRVMGLLHLLVISGSHIAVLVVGLRWGMRFFPIRRETKTLCIIVLLTAFGWMTGMSPPVARAVLVVDVLLIYSLFGRDIRDPIRLLGWCAALMLAAEPNLLENLGFHLTVGMTVFILVTRRLWRGLIELSIYAQLIGLLFLWPVQPVLSFAAPFMNMVMAVAISWLIMPLAFLTYVVPPAQNLFVPVLDGLEGMFRLHDTARPWFALHELSPIQHALLTIGLLLGLVLIEKNRWLGWFCALFTLITVVVLSEGFEKPRVTFLDVGQGDAIVVEQGDVTGVIDVGGVYQNPEEKKRSVFDPGSDIVAPYVWKRGEKTLDFVLLTHADHDHIGGLTGLLDHVQVRELWLSKQVADPVKREELLRLANRHGLRIRLLEEGDTPYPWMRIVAPTKHHEDENENSVSLYMKVGEMTYLLTGDLPIEQEEDLPSIDVDVFKLGHHGSNTSSGEALIERIEPEWVIASVGATNRYGHPHSETLMRISGRRLLRTDRDGMIICEEKGCHGIVEREVSRDEL